MGTQIRLAVLSIACLFFAGCATEPAWKSKAPAPQNWGANNPCTSLSRITRNAPLYPRVAEQERQEGWVALKYHVAANGAIFNVRVVASSPEGVFDDASAAALVKARYAPMEYPVQNCSQIDVYSFGTAHATQAVRPMFVSSRNTR